MAFLIAAALIGSLVLITFALWCHLLGCLLARIAKYIAASLDGK